MNSKLTFIASISVLAAALTACEDKVITKAPGTYENSVSSTNADGTNIDKKTTSNVTIDQYGNKREVTTTKTTTDPKGLFNKSTTTSTTKKVEAN